MKRKLPEENAQLLLLRMLLKITYAKTSIGVPRRCRVNIPFEPY